MSPVVARHNSVVAVAVVDRNCWGLGSCKSSEREKREIKCVRDSESKSLRDRE